jgi:hypothetical protein
MHEPESRLYRFSPDTVILALRIRDVAPDLWRDFSALSREEGETAIARVGAELRDWLRAFRKHDQAHLLIHNWSSLNSKSRESR